ncbi:3-hydroxyacyl-CoA dehydrogenase family protein [Streptomyces varsoviensis]|uniref:3-hydroxybutyryl-CoA dehydrogenase n=1 Tax=Streptomyces varsoviensis TaxID=67373 RepID=A0ABR5J3R1_9ACTN|nr:3-hydroxyacyl-CoA dehydrogenase family protein [Streptomyces varsoviensis]KOG88073.1 hypothetical protein ADK38_21800 [Streptomyces varsoviensis]
MTGRKTPVGVVGAGVIGCSVAHAVARAGAPVTLYDNSPKALDSVADTLRTAERITRLRKGRAALAPVTPTSDPRRLADCEVVIENVTEDIAVKERVHRELDAVLAPESVVAVNTSAVPITRLALATAHPGRVIGAHFMNPVALIDAVEVVRTAYAEPAALERLRSFLSLIGKRSVVVADAAGFVINRCLMMFVNEAADLHAAGVAGPEEIDQLFQDCLGHRSGPLRTADLIGLDTVVRTLEVLAHYYGPARFTPAPLLRQMVDAGRLGRKSGRGFYRYTADEVGAR